MKRLKFPHSEQGMTLVVTLMLALVVMVALDGFLSFLASEYRMVHRTYSYGNAIYLAEAGIEEGFAMVSYGANDWAGNGWSVFNSSNYIKTISGFTSVGGSSVLGSYVVTIYGATNTNPVIVCTGIVDTTSATVAGAGNTNVTRVVRVVLGKRAIFQWGLLAQGGITLNGNASVDSFDSSDPSHSDYDITKGYGTYDSSKRNDNGDVATNGSVTNIVVVGNADIYGHVSMGTGGTVSVGANGFVGSLTNHPSGVVQTSRVSNSMNIDVPLPTTPFTSGIDLGNINDTQAVTGGAGTTPVDYTASAVSLSGSKTLTFSGYSRLYVNGDFGTSGNAVIQLNAGAKVEIYVTGSVSISGNGVINTDQLADSFQLYNTGNQSTSISGNGQFTGTVYAPGSTVSLSGNAVFVGAMVGSSYSISGNADFHYDEALKRTGPSRGYSIVCWQEL